MQAVGYIYSRVSTDTQVNKSGLGRQLTTILEWSSQLKVQVDTDLTYTDEGLSAFHGDNIKQGDLGRFIAAVKDGTIKTGSYLFIEAHDRFSRMTLDEARAPFEELLRLGIKIAVLRERKVYDKASLNDPMSIIQMVFGFDLANRESQQKSERIKAGKAKKRQDTLKGEAILTKNVPAWIRVNHDSNGFQLVDEQAAAVRRMFELRLQGAGIMLIRKTLKEEGYTTLQGKDFTQQTVRRTLTQPQAVGDLPLYTVDKVEGRKPTGEVVTDYYPAVIDRDTYKIVSASFTNSKSAPRQSKLTNPLSGLLICSKCGQTVKRYTKSKVTKSFRCKGTETGACSEASLTWRKVQPEIIGTTAFVIQNILAGTDSSDEVTALERSVRSLQASITERDTEIANLVELVKAGVTEALTDTLETQKARDKLKQELSQAEAALLALTSSVVGLDDELLSDYQSLQYDVEDNLVNARIANELNKHVDHITFDRTLYVIHFKSGLKIEGAFGEQLPLPHEVESIYHNWKELGLGDHWKVTSDVRS